MTRTIRNLNVTAGKLFCISSGAYSDYGYQGHFVALQDITPEKLNAIVQRINDTIEADEDLDKWEAQDLFLPELIKSGLVLEVDCYEIHIGEYGELDLS